MKKIFLILGTLIVISTNSIAGWAKYRDKIINGDYIPNEKLPNEKEMCEKYMASRITVKKPWIYWFQKG